MNIAVMMASGDVDEWEDVSDAIVDMDLGGTLTIVGEPFEHEGEIVRPVEARYAPGMWMKVEFNQ